MVRECAAALLVLPAASCSWILDFSDRAIPRDAPPDPQAECTYREPNDTASTAAAITPADTGPAAICGEDRDYYRFAVPAMTAAVEIRIAIAEAASGDLDLRLLDGAGAPLAASHGTGDGERITCPGVSPACPALTAGDYVFEVLPAVPGAVNRYTFALILTAM
jgi:hypothetical protein